MRYIKLKYLLLAVILAIGNMAQAKQLGFLPDNYFRPFNYAHPQFVLGAQIAPENLRDSEAASLLPWMQRGASALVPSSWEGTQKVLASNPDQSVSFSAGPLWKFSQAMNKGYYRTFTGLALKF